MYIYIYIYIDRGGPTAIPWGPEPIPELKNIKIINFLTKKKTSFFGGVGGNFSHFTPLL